MPHVGRLNLSVRLRAMRAILSPPVGGTNLCLRLRCVDVAPVGGTDLLPVFRGLWHSLVPGAHLGPGLGSHNGSSRPLPTCGQVVPIGGLCVHCRNPVGLFGVQVRPVTCHIKNFHIKSRCPILPNGVADWIGAILDHGRSLMLPPPPFYLLGSLPHVLTPVYRVCDAVDDPVGFGVQWVLREHYTDPLPTQAPVQGVQPRGVGCPTGGLQGPRRQAPRWCV